jgi:hypothetical protein
MVLATATIVWDAAEPLRKEELELDSCFPESRRATNEVVKLKRSLRPKGVH